ncbi:MAG: hypothetical protein ABIV05_10445 [Actinomycetota bacterium]
MRLWKLLGLAGLAGVAATGAVVVRSQRQRSALTPDEVRARLQQRLAQVPADPAENARTAHPSASGGPFESSRRTRWGASGIRLPWRPRSRGGS